MYDVDASQPALRQPRHPENPLPLEPLPPRQPPLVKQLRCERTNTRRQSPSNRKEYPAVARNRLMLPEDVVKRRSADTVRMTSLSWLLELARVAEQDDAARGLRGGGGVGEGHL